MNIRVRNVNFTVSTALTLMRVIGHWPPPGLEGREKMLYGWYSIFMKIFMLGVFNVAQVIDLIMIWGDLPLMTATSFLLLTNLVYAIKIFYLVQNRKKIRQLLDEIDELFRSQESADRKMIVKKCDRDTTIHIGTYVAFTIITVTGWVSSVKDGELPLRAWYPYNTATGKAYIFTYIHQVIAIFCNAHVNLSYDVLITSLTAQCHCSLSLVAHSLRNLCDGLDLSHKRLPSPAQEAKVKSRLRNCVLHHQKVLQDVVTTREVFSIPILSQFTVSMVIICVTMYQLAYEVINLGYMVAMTAYLVCMVIQVLLYCNQGHLVSEESLSIADAAYESDWHTLSTSSKLTLLIMMARSRRIAYLTAGGFTNLSLDTFTAILKGSYSYFTVLKQTQES